MGLILPILKVKTLLLSAMNSCRFTGRQMKKASGVSCMGLFQGPSNVFAELYN